MENKLQSNPGQWTVCIKSKRQRNKNNQGQQTKKIDPSLQVLIKYPGRKPEPITFNITDQEGSVLLSCEDVLKLHLIILQPGLEHMVEGSKLIASQTYINQVSNKTNVQELSQELATPQAIMCEEDIQKYFPHVIDGPTPWINSSVIVETNMGNPKCISV